MLTDVQRAEITAAAHRGAWLMDEHGPSGWSYRVNSDTLRMGSTMHCVIGQTMPDRKRLLRHTSAGTAYFAKLDRLGITPYDQVRYGFVLPDYVWYNDEAWAVLADAWRREIEDRLAAAQQCVCSCARCGPVNAHDCGKPACSGTTTPSPADVREPLILAV